MCHSHARLSSAMLIQLLSFPFGLCRFVVVVSPVILQVIVVSSVVSFGRSVLIPLTSAFLLVISTPDLGRGCLIHAVTRSLGGCESGARTILPR